MPTINGIYVWVEKETMSRPVKIPQHPVEKGLPLTDLVVKEPKALSINGKIVDTKNMKADAIISKLQELAYNGSLIEYKGREVVGNFMIADFNTDKDNKIHGGANFDMELVEVRISKSAYTAPKQTSKTPTLKVGATVVFKGGPVYVSSDATKAAATRGRSTCKITIINTRSWSKHDYHLISTDGKKVYGWVDVQNIEGAGSSSGTVTAPTTNAGTQQTQKKEQQTVTKNTYDEQMQAKVDSASKAWVVKDGKIGYEVEFSPWSAYENKQKIRIKGYGDYVRIMHQKTGQSRLLDTNDAIYKKDVTRPTVIFRADTIMYKLKTEK